MSECLDVETHMWYPIGSDHYQLYQYSKVINYKLCLNCNTVHNLLSEDLDTSVGIHMHVYT